MSGQLKNNTEERKLRVTLLSAGWKVSSNGDLTTINRELAIQMAKHPYVEVSVFLPRCSEEDKKDADGYNVKLIEAVKRPGLKPVFWLASVPDGHAMDCVLGHGVDLGQQIPLIKGNPNYSHCKWIQVVHTAPEEIGMYKSISEGQKMQQTEIELCEMADQVVTIGPKLTDAYKHQLRKQDIFNLTPSILSEFSDVQQASDEERTFCVLVTESGDSEDFYVKGYDVAAKAIAELKDKSYQLKFASKQRGKEDELANKLLQCGIGRNQLMICSFDENRETLANLFSAVDIAILPSKTEGFGLSALEAISAGLPVLVSGNSGIAEALRKVPIGSQCVVDSEDPAEWARAIKAVRYKERNVRLAEARILRENYLQQFSWEKPCNSLVEKMYSLAFGGEMKITVGVDYLKPEEQNMQTGMLTTESVRQQEVQLPRASPTSAAPGSVSHPQTEDLLALKEKNFQSILEGCYHSTKPQSIEEWNWFREYAKEMRLIITGVSVGSLVITVKCESLMILEELWKDYSSGHLGEVVQNCFVTERILKELNLAELSLKTTMDIEEYNACKMFFEKDTLRGALSSEFHSTSSTSESSQKKQQWEKSEQKTKIMETVKLEGASSSEFHSISSTSESPQNQEELKKWKQETKIVETEKQKGTSPLTVEPTTGHGKELIEKEQQRKGMLSPHGSTTSDPEEKLEELHMNLKKQVTCSICLDTYTEPKILSCHHTFCCECLERHAIVNQRQGKFRCPECQVEINLPEGNRFNCLPNSFLHKSLLSVLQAESREGTSPSTVPSTAGHKKKWEVRHNIGKFQEKEGSSSPPPLSTTDLEEKLAKVCEEIKMLRMEGSSPPPVSTVEVELEKLLEKLQKGRMEGSSPPPLLPTTDLEEKLGKVCKEIKMLRMEGSFPVLKFSSIDLEKKLAELRKELKRLRMEGTLPPPELFISDLEDELKQIRTELERQGLEDTPSSYDAINQVRRLKEEQEELLKKLQKGRMEDALSSELHSTSSTSESPQKKEQWEKSDQKTKIMETGKLEGASSSKFHSISSTSESPQNQEELEKWKQKTKIVETEKLKGTSPLTVIPTTGHGKELIGKAQGWKVTSWIVTTLFEAAIDLLVNKDRDKAAEILKDGDVTGQRFHSLIVREIDDIKSKLDVLSRNDLQTSFSFFEEGIALLYEVFDIVESRNELGAATTQVARDDTFSLVEGIRKLELTGLDESAARKLSTAKRRFKDARKEATRAFKNECLKTSDRILAMKCRVMATILETVDNPYDALASCGVCVRELNSLSAVQNSFDVQFKTGIQKVRGLFGKGERREIIFNVCHVNRVIFDIALALGRLDFNLSVDIGENKVIPLCDARVKDLLDRHGKEYCCVPPKPFGLGGKEEHKLKHPMAIATNSSGEFIITDLHHVKVFDNSGNFVKQSSLSTDEANRTFAFEVATDMSDNIFVLIELEKPRSELSYWVYKLTKTADLHHAFRLRGEGKYRGLSVSDKGKVVTLREANTVEEYDTDGEFVRSFGQGIISSARDIIVPNDGLVMVLGDYYVHIFSESGDYLDKFKLQQRDCDYTSITFHRAGEQVVAAGILARNLLQVEIYSKDGEFVYCVEIAIDGWFRNLRKITLTTKGRIACVADGKVFIF